jgi:DNA (cytosine-5)-methyltransferase 1
MNKKLKHNYAVVDLFCGIGGLTHGLISEGFQVVAGLDNDDSCKFAFEANNQTKFFKRDVTTLKVRELNKLFPKNKKKILVGCAPCQPFSTYNSKIKKKAYLNKDEKWKMLYSFAELIRKSKPDIVSMENVPALAKFKNGEVLNDFIACLRKEKYKVTKFIVYCPDYGIPQRRRRLIIFASKHGEIDIIKKTHSPKDYKTVKATIAHLPVIKDGEVSATDPLHRARKLNDINKKRIRATKKLF